MIFPASRLSAYYGQKSLQNDGPRFRLLVEWRLFTWKKKVESPWSNLIHIIELSTSLKRHYWVGNGPTNWVRTLVPVRPWACSVSTTHRNSHLWVLIQLSAQIQPVRTVSWTLYKQHRYWCSAWDLRCWDRAIWTQSGLKTLLTMIQTSCSLSQRPLLNGRRLYSHWWDPP